MEDFNNNEQTKEEFCAPCLMAVPLAVGIGGAGVSAGSKDNNKKIKKIILWSSIALIIISIIVYIILKSRCNTCR